jgi:hypothetical protein
MKFRNVWIVVVALVVAAPVLAGSRINHMSTPQVGDDGQLMPSVINVGDIDFDTISRNASRAYGTDSLTTLFAQNNGYRGNSFDLIATECIEVVGWDINLTSTAGNSGDASWWWKEGTADGFECDSSVWTMLGTVNVVGQGSNNPTHADLGGLVVQPGQTIGIYHWLDDYSIIRTGYTNGGPGNEYSNSDLTIKTYDGLGASAPFVCTVFSGRIWNGTVHYNILPSSDPACGGGGGGGECDLTPVLDALDDVKAEIMDLAADHDELADGHDDIKAEIVTLQGSVDDLTVDVADVKSELVDLAIAVDEIPCEVIILMSQLPHGPTIPTTHPCYEPPITIGGGINTPR